jgi:hypothetical protein
MCNVFTRIIGMVKSTTRKYFPFIPLLHMHNCDVKRLVEMKVGDALESDSLKVGVGRSVQRELCPTPAPSPPSLCHR